MVIHVLVHKHSTNTIILHKLPSVTSVKKDLPTVHIIQYLGCPDSSSNIQFTPTICVENYVGQCSPSLYIITVVQYVTFVLKSFVHMSQSS